MAVKLTSVASLPSIEALPANLETLPRDLHDLDLERQQHARFHGGAELRVLDPHEIDKLA